MPKVSILIPAYNEEAYIQQAVESALAQDYAEKKIVVCDDASTDATREILQKYQANPDVKLHRNPRNLGRVANHRHLLYDLAKGKYAVMLDGDDYFSDKNFLKDAVVLAEENGLGLVFAEAWSVPKDRKGGGSLQHVKFPFTQGVLDWRKLFHRPTLLMHGAVLYRRQAALKLNFYSQQIIADDNESFLRLAIDCRVGFLKRPVYVYRQDRHARRFTVNQRLANEKMITSVYSYVIKVRPREEKLFDRWWRQMRWLLFKGNVLNLLRWGQWGDLIRFLAKYWGLDHFHSRRP